MTKLTNYLQKLGVENIHFGCGARNEALISELDSFNQHFYFDERVASFTALGQAKALNRPVAVCVTSGTAVSECYSAVIEAYYSRVKLIIISADRPKRLWGSYAPQTIAHEGIFSHYVRSQVYDLSLFVDKYPMHINYEVDDRKKDIDDCLIPLNTKNAYKLVTAAKAPVIILTHDHSLSKDQIIQLDKLGYHFHLEVTSDIDSDIVTKRISEKKLINEIKKQNIDLLIKYGATPLTKIWREIDRGNLNINVLGVGRYPLGVANGYLCEDFFELPIPPSFSLKTQDSFVFIREKSEFYIYQNILNQVGDEIIYIGNSMPIRYLQILSRRTDRIFASRGVNGIDGQISTGVGMALAKPTEKLHIIIGDLTFMYDFNSLFHNLPKNLVIHVINNSGGGIFKQVPANQKMIWEHNQDLSELVKSLGADKNVFVYNSDSEQTRLDWVEYNEN